MEASFSVPDSVADAKLYDPAPGYRPIPAVCFDLELCEHNAQCPVIYVRQEFLLVPEEYSPYWSVTKDQNGSFIVKSSHHFGEENESGEKQERTFIWRVTDKFDAARGCWVAVFVD